MPLQGEFAGIPCGILSRIRRCFSPFGWAFMLLLAWVPASPLRAQSVAELATYSGPDRTQKLIDGAKKENALTIYSSMTSADMGALINAFAAKYGIRAQHWRGSSEDIRNRTSREYSGGRYDVDVAETAGPDMEAMVSEQLLQKFATPVSAELIPQATLPHGQWIATRLSVFAGAYNTDIFKPADAPKTYEDLLNPRFKGKLGIEAEDANWFMTVVGAMGEQKGLKLFKDIVAANGMSIRKGHTLLANFVPTGEVPLALTAYSYRVEQLKKEGAPVEIVYLPPVVAFPTGAGIFRRAPHPHAALLFEDFILTEGQKILVERDAVPTNPKAGPVPKDLIFVDLPKFMKEGEKWTRLFKETFASPAR
jgi:iron(III) transport system substrate-binding protein